MLHRSTACLVALLLLCACASAAHSPSARGSNPRLITADEIAQSHQTNAYTVIQSLRPNMLSSRGQTSIHGDDPGVVVFVNGSRFGDVSRLETIAAPDIAEIRALTASEAEYRYGPGFPDGVIDIKLK